MRHYVPKRKNPCCLPHNLYMQMLYLVRDYDSGEKEPTTEARAIQLQAVKSVAEFLSREYKKRPQKGGTFDALRGFFDYPYYSYMFANKKRDLSPGKHAWNLFRSRLCYLVAERLGLIDGSQNHPGE